MPIAPQPRPPREPRKLIAIAAGAIIVCEAEAVPESRMHAHFD
jgi:hypothetical protein